jgi:exopolysaccharide biosynthesis WecB/TagA/CpsF family protein
MERLCIAKSPIDCITFSKAVSQVITEADRGAEFKYVVTPNVDHIVRSFHDEHLQSIYKNAFLSLCDSRVFAFLARLKGYPIKEVVTGSDLTERVVDNLSAVEKKITIIGGSECEIKTIKRKYGIAELFHYNPPMGFIFKEEEVNRCVEFVVNHPSDLVFLAVGSPQQERLAYRISLDSRSRGLGLCIGASFRFLAGTEKRAPKYLSDIGLEWLFRLWNDPKRLWRRYFRDLYIFYLMIFRVRRYR